MPVIETALTRFLGIEHPILLAPMGSAAGGRLAAAVTHAGGLGRIGSGDASTKAIKEELAEAGNARVGIGFILWALERNPAADLRLWKMWYFGRIPWNRTTVTPESLYTSRSLRIVFDGTVALHRGGPP